MPGMDEVLAARRAARDYTVWKSHSNVVSVFYSGRLIPRRGSADGPPPNPAWLAIFIIGGFFFSQSPKIAKQWERAVVLRLGKYTGLRGPGLFWITPFVETISIYIDQRVITTSFAAEERSPRTPCR